MLRAACSVFGVRSCLIGPAVYVHWALLLGSKVRVTVVAEMARSLNQISPFSCLSRCIEGCKTPSGCSFRGLASCACPQRVSVL
eukprot:scaffold1704_cov246-Pinguiococcus_pyrenoidosus.AAC.10